MKFSVIIPTYNRADYLRHALDSVLAQTYRDYEIIVADDGSTDNTQEFLRSYDPQIRYVYQDNQGPAAARNSACAIARGEILAFLDSDDTWTPNNLERQAAYWNAHPNLGMVEGFFETRMNGEKLLPNSAARKRAWISRRKKDSYEGWLSGNGDAQLSAVTIRKIPFHELGGFDPALRVCEDFDLILRIIGRYETGYLDGEAVSTFRFHASIPVSEMNEAYRNVLKKHLQVLEENPSTLPRVNPKNAIRKLLLSLSKNLFLSGDKESGRMYFLEAVRRDPRALLSLGYFRYALTSILPSGARNRLRSLRERL